MGITRGAVAMTAADIGAGDSDAPACGDGATPHEVPPDVAARLLRAFDQSPSTVVTLIDEGLRTRWISRSTRWVTGTDPARRAGRGSLERVHPDDVGPLLHALAQLRAARPRDARGVPVLEPLRYRIRDHGGGWLTMESLVLNMLDDPEVRGLVLIGRRAGGAFDGVGNVVDLLTSEAPLPEVLAACAQLVPSYVGSAAVVALVEGGPLVVAPPGSPAAALAGDDRWWRAAIQGGDVVSAVDFTGMPADLAEAARARGFRSVWASAVREPSTGEVMGCVAVWVLIDVEINVASDHGIRQALRLASLVLGEQRRHQALQREAVTDPLTGVGNRTALRRRLDGAEGPVTVAMVDLDDFKPVNDTHGHEAGDRVLRTVAGRLQEAVRQEDLLVRLGGDEFAIVYGQGTSPEGAAGSVRRITGAVAAPIALEAGPTVSVGASVGIATGPPGEVVHLADAALYAAKRAKRRPATSGDAPRG